MPASLDYLFAAFDQSTDSQCFATVTQAIERHRLRIYSVGSNQLTHDYELKNGESITSLTWGHVVANQPEDSKKKQVKKAKAKKPSSLDKVVLLGTDKGSILLYSVDQDKVTKTVPGNGQVIDALINDLGTTIYSLSNTGTLIAWSLEDAQPVSEWKTKLKGAHKLALDQEASLLAVAGQGKIELWDLVKGQIVKTIKPSDKHSVDNLVFTKHNNTLISAGKTTIDLWSTKADITEPTQSISVEEGVQQVDLISATNDDDMTLLAVTNKGNVHVWKSKQSGLKATTTIKIMSSKHNQVPILYAKFTKLQKQTAIAIARGSSAKPVLEAVSITDGKNKPLRDIVLTRQTAGATHSNMESDDEDETQKEDMDIDPTIQHTPEKLVKALQLDNKTTIINYVEQTTDADVVDNTIRQLPIAYIRPLVLLLVDEIESKPASDVGVQLLWLKRMVSFHYQHLLDDSTIVKKLAALSQVLTVHATETFPKVIALRGRVEMIQQQLDLRSKRAQLDEEDALLDLEPMEDSDEDSEDEDSGNDEDDDDDLDDFEEDDDEDELSGHRHIKDEDMFLEEMAEDDVADDDADSDIDDSDASM